MFVTFTVASSFQRAVAYGLDHEAAFYTCVRMRGLWGSRKHAMNRHHGRWDSVWHAKKIYPQPCGSTSVLAAKNKLLRFSI